MKQHKNRTLKRVLVTVAVLALAVGILTATGVFAGLIDSTAEVKNEMKPAEVSCAVERYSVRNTGSIPAVVRVKVLINWIDAEGNVVLNPKGGSYQAKPTSSWTHLGGPELCAGEWYYDRILGAGEGTDSLFSEIKVTQKPENAEQLQVQILAEALQAAGKSGDKPVTVVTWGVNAAYHEADVTWSY